VQLR
jgi:hypothetical protein